RVAMTPAATRFVAPLTFQALSGAPVLVDLLDPTADLTYGHLELARAADLVIVAPATADLLARLRAGMADDAVTTTVLAATCPVLLAPAMNTRMWRNPATAENVAALRARGLHLVGPASGELADGDVGEGRLADPAEIALAGSRLLGALDLAGRKVLVTAGPTREPIDPVRFISNPSSGKMGYAVARVAARRGAEVTLVSGPTALPDPPDVEVVRVETAEEMARAVEGHAAEMDLFVGAAAVSDYRPRTAAAQKIKKRDGDETLVLSRTADILAGLGRRLAGQPRAPVLVGFAAETEEVIARAREKLKGKGCDLVVANKVGGPSAGFGADTNRVALVSATELAEIEGTKEKVAEAILDWILPVLDARRPRQGEG
ncbi:MAG TPA: bifunctional phosphopantothenoylcysteine decarboxylase/phosphopantothenate--cysteine ligase CoaBC, partial [Anaeromyxobacter sp.]|nr:bifunctional phosphopantothenoylcysteine decarboxylase/phosphopantothenate--cysteine ligase CoaBC [Anaeromyxobacter sp.]